MKDSLLKVNLESGCWHTKHNKAQIFGFGLYNAVPMNQMQLLDDN